MQKTAKTAWQRYLERNPDKFEDFARQVADSNRRTHAHGRGLLGGEVYQGMKEGLQGKGSSKSITEFGRRGLGLNYKPQSFMLGGNNVGLPRPIQRTNLFDTNILRTTPGTMGETSTYAAKWLATRTSGRRKLNKKYGVLDFSKTYRDAKADYSKNRHELDEDAWNVFHKALSKAKDELTVDPLRRAAQKAESVTGKAYTKGSPEANTIAGTGFVMANGSPVQHPSRPERGPYPAVINSAPKHNVKAKIKQKVQQSAQQGDPVTRAQKAMNDVEQKVNNINSRINKAQDAINNAAANASANNAARGAANNVAQNTVSNAAATAARKGLSRNAKIGLGVGAGVLAAGGTAAAIHAYRKHKRRQQEEAQRRAQQDKTASQIIDEMYKEAGLSQGDIVKNTLVTMGLSAMNSGAKAAGGMSGTAAVKAAMKGAGRSLLRSAQHPTKSLAKGALLAGTSSALDSLQRNVSQPQTGEGYGTGAY